MERKMKRAIFMLLVFSGISFGIELYDGDRILNGQEYENVHVISGYVEMLGGIVGTIDTQNSSNFKMDNGYTSYLTGHNDSTIDIAGGNIYVAASVDYANMKISGGSTELLEAVDDSHMNIWGGSVASQFIIQDRANVNIYGGDFSFIRARNAPTINIYGYDFEYNNFAGNYGDGQLTGKWSNGNSFAIDLYFETATGERTYPHLSFVLTPEPATVLLLGVGGVLLRIRKS
jgi:hypothetical protein